MKSDHADRIIGLKIRRWIYERNTSHDKNYPD